MRAELAGTAAAVCKHHATRPSSAPSQHVLQDAGTVSVQCPALTSQHLSAGVSHYQLGEQESHVILSVLAKSLGICAHSALKEELLEFVPAWSQPS